MFNILVVEPDLALCEQIQGRLIEHGFSVYTAASAPQAIELIGIVKIDLIVSDTQLRHVGGNKSDGHYILSELRESGSDTPFIYISGQSRFEDLEKGFLLGADDYMRKPIDVRELIWRIKAILRRAKSTTQQMLIFGDVILDYKQLTVSRMQESVTLPRKEFYLLFKLLSFPGWVFSRRDLIDEIWGMDSNSNDRTVDVHINRLRDRFEKWHSFEIVTVRGVGYKATPYNKNDKER